MSTGFNEGTLGTQAEAGKELPNAFKAKQVALAEQIAAATDVNAIIQIFRWDENLPMLPGIGLCFTRDLQATTDAELIQFDEQIDKEAAYRMLQSVDQFGISERHEIITYFPVQVFAKLQDLGVRIGDPDLAREIERL